MYVCAGYIMRFHLDADTIPYTSKHSRGKTFVVHQQYALCRETFVVCRLKLRARLCKLE